MQVSPHTTRALGKAGNTHAPELERLSGAGPLSLRLTALRALGFAAPKGLESTGDPIMNLSWTQAGLPAMNLPTGKNQDGLPLGLQVVGSWGKDETLLLWAQDLEEVLQTV